MSVTMPGRMLRLLSLLQERREWSGAELAARLGVTDRTVRRDVDRLRELGYPVDGTTGTAGGYRLRSGRDLPPLLLDDDEAVTIAALLLSATAGVEGVADASVRALAKLQRLLPARLRDRLAAMAAATVPVPDRTAPRADPVVLGVLATASRDHELVEFDYLTRGGGTGRRRVEPHGLVATHRLWYLVGYDTDRGDWRTFRADRVSDPRPAHRRFAPRDVPGGDLAGYVRRSVTTAPFRYTADAVVQAPAEVVRARLTTAIPGRIEPLDDRSCRLRLASDSLSSLARDLVGLDAEFTVEGDRAVLDHLDTLGRRLTGAVRR